MSSEIKYPELLLLRYSNYLGIDTIAKHQEVINEIGYCWFGKIGKMPSKKIINAFLKNKGNIAFLYTYGILYESYVSEVSYERPEKGTPSYYDYVLYLKEETTPKIFFKMEYIKRVDVELLENYLVVSSGKDLKYDLTKSISSYYLIRDKKGGYTPKAPPKERSSITKNKKIVSNECIYRKENNICFNPRCINYGYDCIGPKRCIKQKFK